MNLQLIMRIKFKQRVTSIITVIQVYKLLKNENQDHNFIFYKFVIETYLVLTVFN